MAKNVHPAAESRGQRKPDNSFVSHHQSSFVIINQLIVVTKDKCPICGLARELAPGELSQRTVSQLSINTQGKDAMSSILPLDSCQLSFKFLRFLGCSIHQWNLKQTKNYLAGSAGFSPSAGAPAAGVSAALVSFFFSEQPKVSRPAQISIANRTNFFIVSPFPCFHVIGQLFAGTSPAYHTNRYQPLGNYSPQYTIQYEKYGIPLKFFPGVGE